MAADKKSFVLYADSYGLIKQLPDDVAGKLLKHIFAYVNDENPVSDDLLLNIAFEPIKMHLKRDLKKFELIKEKRSIAGKKSAEIRQQNSTNSTHVDFVQQTSTNSTVSDSVSDNVSDSDSDSVSTNVDVVVDVKKIDDDFLKYKILFFKNFTDDYDFVFEIQKVKNKLDDPKDESEFLFLSRVLNFLISEKRKKVPPKKESIHQLIIDELKTSEQWLDVISSQNNLTPENIRNKLDEFKEHLFTEQKEHQTKNEFLRHFKSWLRVKNNSKNEITNGKQQFRFSTTEAIETISSNSARGPSEN